MQVSCLERTTSSTASTLLKAGESHTAVDSNSNSAGGKSQVDKGAENLHCGTRDALQENCSCRNFRIESVGSWD